MTGYDPAAAALAGAREVGAIDAAAASLRELAASVDTLVLAAPLDATLDQLRDLRAAFANEADARGASATRRGRPRLILDVASVKTPVAAAGRALAEFVPTHPIAGSQRSGPHAARADLFVDRVWTIDPNVAPEALGLARAFVGAMGARAVELESGEHDRIVARTSHLPQLLSVALGAILAPAAADARTRALCGTGAASMLRLAESSWPLWRPILTENAALVSQEVRALAAVLSDVAAALDAGDHASLATLFASSAAAAVRLRANDTAPGDVRESDSPSPKGELP